MRRLLLLALALAVALPAVVSAGKPKDKEKRKSKKRTEVAVKVDFGADDRDKVRLFFVEKHGRGNCPPGLAKKNNGCLPPGLAKKRYAVGQPLPHGVEVVPLPAELSVRIGPAPTGYRFAIVDGDLVKLAVGTMLVVDAIGGLVE